MEVNHSPSFATGSQVDLKVKERVIQDTFSILGVTKERKIRLMRLDKKRHGIRNFADREKRIEEVFKVQEYWKELDKYQLSNKGMFDRVYPPENKSGSNIAYERIMAQSSSMYHKFTGIYDRNWFSNSTRIDLSGVKGLYRGSDPSKGSNIDFSDLRHNRYRRKLYTQKPATKLAALASSSIGHRRKKFVSKSRNHLLLSEKKHSKLTSVSDANIFQTVGHAQ